MLIRTLVTGMFEEVEQVRYYPGPAIHVNLLRNAPQAHNYPSGPVIPQGYGLTDQLHPTPSHQPTHLAVRPNTPYHPTPSAYLKVPDDRHGGSRRSSDLDYPESHGALIPYNNPDSIERWARSVGPGNTPTASVVGSNAQYPGSTTRRDKKNKDRDRRRGEEKSRGGSSYRSPRDLEGDAESRADGRTLRMDPRPIRRKKPTTQGASSHCPSVTQGR